MPYSTWSEEEPELLSMVLLLKLGSSARYTLDPFNGGGVVFVIVTQEYNDVFAKIECKARYFLEVLKDSDDQRKRANDILQ